MQCSFCMSMCWNIHYKVTITGTSSEGKKGRGRSEGIRGHITPSICETAVQLQGIMYYFWWIMLITKRRTWFLPPQRTLPCILKEAMAFHLPFSCAVSLSYVSCSLTHCYWIGFLSSFFFFSFLPLTKCAVPRDLGKLFHVSLLFDIAAVWSATLGRPRPI